MTVSTTDNKAFFTGNGVTTSFDFTFKYFNDSDITVYLDGEETEDYTLTRNPSGDGGTITFDPAPTTETDGGLIYRELPFTQGTRIPTSDKIPRGTLENAFDRVTILTQQLQEQLGRSLTLPITFNNSQQLVLPEPEAGRALVWRDDLQGLDNTSVDLETLLADCTTQANAAAASASAAAASMSSASVQASAAAASATTGAGYRDNAYKWSSESEDVPVNDGVRSGYSAYHWSRKAQGLSVPMSNKGELFGRGDSGNVAVPAPTQDGQVLVSSSAAASGMTWGDGMFTGAVVAAMRSETLTPPGWLVATGTIGSAASGASRRANADAQPLYEVLWASFSNSIAPVSGGRGASAAADFAADKTLTIPDMRDLFIVGKGNMGGTSANILADAKDGANSNTLGGLVGEPTHTMTVNEMVPHTHAINAGANAGSGSNRYAPGYGSSLVTGSTGGGDAFNVTPKARALNLFIKM